MNQAVNWEQACPTFVTTKVEGISVAHLQVVPGCVYLYMRKGVLFIISSFCIVMYEREHKWLNSKLVPVFYSQEHSWSALIGNQKYIFSLSLFISSSAYSASYVKAWQLSSNFKHSAKMIYIYIYIRTGRERHLRGLLLACYNYSVSNTEGEPFNLPTQLLIQVEILTLMSDTVTVERWDLPLIHYAPHPS